MLPSVSRVSRVHDVVFTRIRVYTMSLGRCKRTHRLVTHILGIKKKSQKEKKNKLYFILTIFFYSSFYKLHDVHVLYIQTHLIFEGPLAFKGVPCAPSTPPWRGPYHWETGGVGSATRNTRTRHTVIARWWWAWFIQQYTKKYLIIGKYEIRAKTDLNV